MLPQFLQGSLLQPPPSRRSTMPNGLSTQIEKYEKKNSNLSTSIVIKTTIQRAFSRLPSKIFSEAKHQYDAEDHYYYLSRQQKRSYLNCIQSKFTLKKDNDHHRFTQSPSASTFAQTQLEHPLHTSMMAHHPCKRSFPAFLQTQHDSRLV